MLKHIAIIAFASASLLAGCSQKAPEPGTIPPATQAERDEFGGNPGDKVNPRQDASVKELFCMNALGAACPADIDERLAVYSVGQGFSRIDLTDSFVRLKASQDLGDPNALITDEAYVEACYNVILGRHSDPGGFTDAVKFVKDTGERKTLVQSILRSPEFRTFGAEPTPG